MSAKQLLLEMLQLLREQVEHVVKGEYQALLEGTRRHEQLLSAMETAEPGGTPEELRAIYEEIQFEKIKLQSLIESESVRVDFELRILLGGTKSKSVGYPDMNKRGKGASMLNRRT